MNLRKAATLILLMGLLCAWAGGKASAITNVQGSQLLDDIQQLSDDDKTGREPATPGHAKAAEYLRQRYQRLALKPLRPRFSHAFIFTQNMVKKHGTNIIGSICGTTFPNEVIVFTAHYDHLGRQGHRIFNGADDNASGVAVMLAVAQYFATHAPEHAMLFVATDAEESGLHGAKELLNDPTIRSMTIRLNINLDMLGNGGKKQILFMLANGINGGNIEAIPAAIPQLSELPFRLSTNPRRIYRDAGSRNTRQAWRRASDHSVFGEAGIPYLFFASDVHRHYHKDSDTIENISEKFVTGAAEAVIAVAAYIDANAKALLTQSASR